MPADSSLTPSRVSRFQCETQRAVLDAFVLDAVSAASSGSHVHHSGV